MNKEEVIEILNKHELKFSAQFLDFAMKFNSKDLVEEFCKYWKNRPVGGGDLNQYFMQYYNKKLGEQ